MKILFECDGTRCGEKCSFPLCRYTDDVTHAANFKPAGVADNYIEKSWTPITKDSQMPDEGEEVLVTLWIGGKDGKVDTGVYAVDVATYSGSQYYVPDISGRGGFTTVNDWIEGEAVVAVAWKKKPLPYICSNAEREKCLKVWKEFRK